jgi:DNA-binding transcriptional regulator GbsR (MarR family)
MAKQKTDPKVEWGFFAVTPRIVRTQYKELSHTEKWLYVCLKDLCGDRGMCYRTLRVLAQETDLSTGNLSTGIRKLHEAGLIHAEKKRRTNNPTAKEVWHITIVDIWQANVEYCSKYEQSTQDNVQELNNNVQNMNEPSIERSENEQKRSNFDDRRINTEEQHIEERTIKEGISLSDESDAPTQNIISYEDGLKRKTEPRIPAVKIGVTNGSQFRHPLDSSNPGAARVDSDSDTAGQAEKGQEVNDGTLPSDVSNSAHPGASDGLPARISETVAQHTTSTSGSSATPVQRVGSPLTGNLASAGAAQGGKKRTRKPVEPIVLKSDTREVQRRINEHRGYALEDKGLIINECNAIKTWCGLHTIEEFGLVMAGAKKDKFWGKQENYYRIGGSILLKITPEILARQRTPLQMVANGDSVQHEDEDYSDFDVYKGNGKEERAALRALGEEMEARGELIW